MLMAARAAEFYDAGEPCGVEANGAKFLRARRSPSLPAGRPDVRPNGLGQRVSRRTPMREVLANRIGPVTEQMILCFIAENILDQSKSYRCRG
jgi:acyl-CoA dehydrogenase